MKRTFIILSLISCLCLGLNAQHVIRFTNADGFPDVIVQGQSYTLSGWIKNYGTASGSTPSVFKVNYSVNGGTTVQVGGNFNLGSLSPGDSVYWSHSGHVFAANQFSGHHNDILIWPTVPNQQNNDTRSETVLKEVYYAEEAAFRMRNDDVVGFGSKIDPYFGYTVSFSAKNVGASDNAVPVQLYAEDAHGNTFLIAEDQGIFTPGSIVTFNEGIRLAEIIPSANLAESEKVFFFARAKKDVPPVQKAGIGLTHTPTSVAPSLSNGLGIYPNPSEGIVNFDIDVQANPADVSWSLYNAQGQQVLRGAYVPQQLNLSDLPAGVYTFVLNAGVERLSKQVLLR